MSHSAKDPSSKTTLITGANSGLGFEAAAQLAEAGYGRVILACRTLEKAEQARAQLVERLGKDPFETLAVDVSSVESARAASDELVSRGNAIDALLLNAGMVAGDAMGKSVDGLELAFASSIVGHHVLTVRLHQAGLLPEGARVVIAGSEGARNDLPGTFGMRAYDFAVGAPREFGDNLHDAMTAFARGSQPDMYDPMRYYAATKTFVSWWSAAMARKLGGRVLVFTVSPGSNMGTNAARHATRFRRFLFTKIMPAVGSFVGMNMPTSLGAKRYVDVLTGNGEYSNGHSYMSKPKKLTGPIEVQTTAHFLDRARQDAALGVIEELTGQAA